MSDLPENANVVVIGAGIVGNSVVGHLAELGWRDIVQIDKGPLPNPGGSTGHASNFIFPVDHNKEMALLTLDSQRQYIEMGRQHHLRRHRDRPDAGAAGGVPPAGDLGQGLGDRRLAHLAQGGAGDGALHRRVDRARRLLLPDGLGGRLPPGRHPLPRAGAGQGRAQTFANIEVLALETSAGRVTAVVTDQGRIETEHVVIACGVWSPRIADMAGASIPLTPAVHQMIDVGPIPILEATGNELGFPIVRDMDMFMYERQTAGSMEVGSYAHRPIFHRPDEIPSIQESRLSPTELPFTAEDFDEQLEDALELMPDILATAEIKYAINGLLSLTPDGFPLLGETPEVRNLWSAAAVWIKEGPGAGRMIAEWMTHGVPEIDPHQSDIARFYPYARNDHHVRARCAEHFNKTYGIVHPREQWASERNLRSAPYHARTEALGAVYFQAGGWERPHWYTSNAPLVEHYGVEDRPHEWDARWWSPISSAEHLAMRERVGMVDLAPFVVFDVSGPGALDFLQTMTVNSCDVAVGRSVYTPLLDHHGGFRTDLTIMRLGETRFRVVTGAFDGPRDEYWFRKHLPDGRLGHASTTAPRPCAPSGCGVPGPATW